MKDLVKAIEEIQNVPLRKICMKLVCKPHQPFALWPASLSHHHAYPGGLLEHTLEVCAFAAAYPVRLTWQRDVVIAASLWHDVGKTTEYALMRKEDAVEGRRFLPFHGNIGWSKPASIEDGKHPHIQWSADTFVAAARGIGIDQEVVRSVEGCILSHHGRLEWGAVHEPRCLVEELVHQADLISAKYYGKL